MEEVKKFLLAHDIPEAYADKVAKMSWDIYRIYGENYEIEDVKMVAEDSGIKLTEAQLNRTLAIWRSLEDYGRLPREDIEYAINEAIKGE